MDAFVVSANPFKCICAFYGIHHYADEESYKSINSVFNILLKTNNTLLESKNYDELIYKLEYSYEQVKPKYKFIYQYIYNEFNKYQIYAKNYFENSKEFNIRLIGYSRSRGCTNMKQLKKKLDKNLKTIKLKENLIAKTDNSSEDTFNGFIAAHVNEFEKRRDFIITARYVCDFLEETPDFIPKNLFINY